MAKIKDIEEIFLSILQEDNNKDEINQKTQYFTDSDWRSLSDFSIKNGLFPPFYTRLLSLNLKNMPPLFLSRIKKRYLRNLKRNIILEQELLRILSHFKELNIPTISLKGPILTRYLYHDLALRQAPCDLDILVKVETINLAKEGLRELGYSLNPSCVDRITDFLHPVGYGPERHFSFTRYIDENFTFHLDLHQYIRGFLTDEQVNELWQDYQFLNVQNQQILMLSKEDLLIYLCLISITPLEFIQIKYLYDLHRLIFLFGKDINWHKLRFKSKQLGCAFCLYFPLKLSRELFSTDIPEEFLSKIKPHWLVEKIISVWINKKNTTRNLKDIGLRNLFNHLLRLCLYSRNPLDFFKKCLHRLKINSICQSI